MKTYSSIYAIDDSVTLTLDNIKHRQCTVTAVKFETQSVRVDLLLPSGQRLYDICESWIELTGVEAERISKSELQ